MSVLAPSLEAFFTDRLVGQRAASQNTIAAYALTFRLLLGFASARSGVPPSRLDIAQLDAPLVAAFLEHLERERGNTAATRNARLAAIHSLFSYMALHHPEHAGSIGRVLSIPNKRTQVNLVTYLTEDEATALLAACDQRRWTGRRDHTMFALTIQTGLRISELVGLSCADVTPWPQRQRAHLRQGTQGAAHPARREHGRDPSGLSRRACWSAERPTLRHEHGKAPQPRRRRASARPPRRADADNLPVHRRKADHHAHAATHRGDAPPARRQ